MAVLISVTAMASVGLFADRISRALVNQSNELLGADKVVYSMREIPDAWRAKALTLELQTSENKEFYSVVVAGEKSTLAEVKAVDEIYPLRGELEVKYYSGEGSRIPSSGNVWVEQQLLYSLQLNSGDKIQLGNQFFTISAVIKHEPDRAGSLFSLAPRLMMNQEDLNATGLIGPGSRVRYRLLLAGSDESLEKYTEWVTPQLNVNYELRSVRDSRPEVRVSLERAEHFLSLTLIVTLILSCVTIWVAIHTWVHRRMMVAAVLKTIGLTRAHILRLFIGQLLVLSLIACLIACLFAIGIQSVLVRIMQSYVTGELPGISLPVLLTASGMGVMLVLAFAIPGYFRFADTAPNLVLRSVPDRLQRSSLSFALGLVVLAGVLAILVRDAYLLAYTLAGLVAAVTLLLIMARGLVTLLSHFPLRLGLGVRLGINGLVRHRRETVLMMSVFGLSFIFVAVLALIRTDLVGQWRDRLPAGTPNTFLVNIAERDRDAVRQWLIEHGLSHVDVYPMVKGRLIEINHRKVSGDDYDSERTKRLVQREFNLSWSDQLPEHNKLVSGDWWPANARPQWSVEQGIAERLGIRIGDTLTYDVSGQQVSGMVTNIREVRWDSFKVNFFVLSTSDMLVDYPAKYISSFYLEPGRQPLMSNLVTRFPSVTVLDTDIIINRIRGVIDKVAIAAETAFVFTLLAAVMLVVGMINAGRKIRQQEVALMRSMGATRATLIAAQTTEFMLLGASAGILAVIIANGMAWYIATSLLDFEFSPNFAVATAIVVSGMILSMLTGWIIIRSQHRESPMRLLRKG